MKRKLIIGGIIAVVAIFLGVTVAGGAMGEKRIAKHMELGNKYLEEGNYEQAILSYEAVIKIDENSIEARTAMAKAYIGLVDMEQAETIAREAIAIDETQAEPWSVLTEIYEQTKTKSELAQLYQEAFEKTGDTQFSNWIKAHTPAKPMANYASGAYEEYLTIQLTNQYEEVEVEYNLNEETVEALNELQNGEYNLSITATNDYNLSNTNEYQYSIELADYVIEFVDLEFERMLRMAMNKPEGDIYKSELDGITELEIWGDSHAGINSKQTWALNQIHINVEANVITYWIDGVHYNNNGKITRLDDVAHIRNLKRLSISCNEINNIDGLLNLKQLESLSLDCNQIKDISKLSDLHSLNSLSLSCNQLIEISPLKQLNKLESLNISGNDINEFSALGELIDLKYLDISDTKFTNMGIFNQLIKLEGLGLNHNQITNIDELSKLKSLTSLSLMYNQINDISILSNLTNLKYLYLTQNNITDIEPLSDLKQLKYLGISENPIMDYTVAENMANTQVRR